MQPNKRRNKKLLKDLGVTKDVTYKADAVPSSVSVRNIKNATPGTERYGATTDYAQRLGLKLSPVTSGEASQPALKEFGQKRDIKRENKLVASLGNRTTTASRKRATQRLLTQFGIRSS